MATSNLHRKLMTSSGSPNTDQQHPKSPPTFPTDGWKEKLSHYLKYLFLGSSTDDSTANAKDDLQRRFYFDEDDLESEESLRKLYDRWMVHYGVCRPLWKQKVHFEAFKENAQTVYESSRILKHRRFGLNSIADYTKDDRRELMFGTYDPRQSCRAK